MTGKTNLYLYKNTKFYKHMSYKIDDINSFLATLQLDKLTFEDLQYFRPDSLQKELKIVFNQKGIKNLHQYNYARIEIINVDGTREWELFYFVDRIEWISMDCIKLHMTCDTLNSFLDSLEFHPKTFIEREHCDRWNYESYIKNDTTHKMVLLRDIPELNESLNPQKYAHWIKNNQFTLISKQSQRMRITATQNDQPFIAIYLGDSSHDDQSPLYFIPALFGDNPFYIDYGSGAIESTRINNLNRDAQDNQRIIVIPYPPHKELFDISSYTQSNPFRETSDGLLKAKEYTYNTSTPITSLKALYYRDVDKLIPEQESITISGWMINGETFDKFDSYISSIFIATFYNFESLTTEIKNNGYFKQQGYSNESAMYNSEFLEILFDYMDNTYSIALEDFKYNGSKTLEQLLDFDNYPNGFISIKYAYSLFMDNSIYFKFDSGQDSFDITFKLSTSYIMIVPLLSQLPIINNDWLNYQRNGYNFDVKIRDVNREQRQNEYQHQQTMFGSNLVKKVINPLNWVGLTIQGNELDRYQQQSETLTRMQEDLQLDKQIAQAKGSKLGIEQISGGLDKVNQTSAKYRLGISFMLPRKSWWKYLEDYFYYFGNKVQYYGVPTHNNRCLFDYLKCRAEFVNRNNVPNNEALQDIIQRLGNGVVFIHKYLNQYTFDSDYKENVENRLLEIIQGE